MGLKDQPLGNMTVMPYPETRPDIFEFTSKVSPVGFHLPLHAEGELVDLNIQGNFYGFEVYIHQNDGTIDGPVKNTAGQTNLTAFEEHDFRANFTSNSTIRIEFTGPTEGFYVNITKFTVCLTPMVCLVLLLMTRLWSTMVWTNRWVMFLRKVLQYQ